MSLNKRNTRWAAAVAAAVLIMVAGLYLAGPSGSPPNPGLRTPAAQAAQVPTATNPDAAGDHAGAASVELSETQLQAVKVEPVGQRVFATQSEAVGNIGFNDDVAVQVFSPYPGKIMQALARLGDEVVKGQKLFTVDSPDLAQAESVLIAAAATRDLTTRTLTRARQLQETQGVAQKELEQAISDQQGAEGACKAARNALRLFGKTEAEIDHIVAQRRIRSHHGCHQPHNGQGHRPQRPARTLGAAGRHARALLGGRHLDHVDAGLRGGKR